MFLLLMDFINFVHSAKYRQNPNEPLFRLEKPLLHSLVELLCFGIDVVVCLFSPWSKAGFTEKLSWMQVPIRDRVHPAHITPAASW